MSCVASLSTSGRANRPLGTWAYMVEVVPPLVELRRRSSCSPCGDHAQAWLTAPTDSARRADRALFAVRLAGAGGIDDPDVSLPQSDPFRRPGWAEEKAEVSRTDRKRARLNSS